MITVYSKCNCCGEVDKMVDNDMCVKCTVLLKQLETDNFEKIKDKKKQLKNQKKYGIQF